MTKIIDTFITLDGHLLMMTVDKPIATYWSTGGEVHKEIMDTNVEATITDLKIAKEDLEREITILIEEFIRNRGVNVERIDLDCFDVTSVGSKKKKEMVVSVRVKVSL